MITKAVITDINALDNKYVVNIPLFESPGISSTTSKLNNTLFSATLSHEPSLTHSYAVGDVVFVSFEDDELDRPVILGKLYLTDEEAKDRGKLDISTLEVHDKVTLPKHTTIGDIDFNKLFDYFNSINDYIEYLLTNGGGSGVSESAIKDGSGRVIEDTYANKIQIQVGGAPFDPQLYAYLYNPKQNGHSDSISSSAIYLPKATSSGAGIMSHTDKIKLDNTADTVDDILDGDAIVDKATKDSSGLIIEDSYGNTITKVVNRGASDMDIELDLLSPTNKYLSGIELQFTPATQSLTGMMSAADKTKLDNLLSTIEGYINYHDLDQTAHPFLINQIGLLQSEIARIDDLESDLGDGTLIVDRARKDGSGRNIEDTYLSDVSMFEYSLQDHVIHLMMDSPTTSGIVDIDIFLPIVTEEYAGLMSSEDKTKLDNITEDSFGVNIIRLVN